MKKIIAFIILLVFIFSLGVVAFADTSIELKEKNKLEVFYLDVGEGDAIVVTCDGHAMMIDGGDSQHSSYVYSFLKSKGIDRIDYMIATHPDADHIGGLSGALNYAKVGVVFCTKTNYNTKQFDSFLKYLDEQKCTVTVPNVGDTFTLGEARVKILAPERNVELSDNTSIVFKIEYGNTSFLFVGDSEQEDEESLIKSGYNIKADILKLGHHGSSSSSTAQFLKAVDPMYAVISVGENNYGHPADDVLFRLEQRNIKVYRTDECGIITVSSDGDNITVESEKQSERPERGSGEQDDSAPVIIPMVPVQTVEPEPEPTPKPIRSTTDYIINTNTGKFHYPSCGSVKKMKDSNKQYYNGTRDDLIASGYSPCGNCHP